MPKKILELSIILIIIYSTLFSSTSPINAMYHKEIDRRLPVLLIHGFLTDASVWNTWQDLLKRDNIPFEAVTFKQDDKCGSAEIHAAELNEIVKFFKKQTGEERINIVAHSKGGLDARLYLSNNLSNNDVANLVMIGTANAGSPLANAIDICTPAIEDLRIKAAATNATRNPHTNYYTIAGDWNPALSSNCLQFEWLPSTMLGYFLLQGREGNNDGIVPISSVESQDYFINLGHTADCHSSMLGYKEYKLAQKVTIEIEL